MNKKGFSLMELIIVIVIMGILVGAMLPMFANNTTRARTAKVQSEEEAIRTAVLMYHADTGSWPATGTTGAGLMTAPTGVSNWAGPYMDQWKNDPWNNSYSIITGAAANSLTPLYVCSTLNATATCSNGSTPTTTGSFVLISPTNA